MHIKIPSEELYQVLDATSVYRDEAIMQFKKKGVMIRVQDKSGTALYNTLIPDTAMDSYERGENPRLGIHVEDMLGFVPNNDDLLIIDLESDGINKFNMQAGSREFRVPAIDPNTVQGEPEMVPDIDMPIKIKMEPDKILSFISDTYDKIYNGNEEAEFYLQAQEGTFNIWSKRDDYELYEWFHWEDFEDYDINWNNTQPAQNDNLPGDPREDKQAVTIMACNLTKGMKFFADTVRLEMSHGMPLKMVSETEAGVKHSWIVPPRWPSDGDPTEIPQRVIKDRAVV